MIKNEWMQKVEAIARQRLQQPPTFEVLKYEAMDDGSLLVTGAIPVGYRTRGKRKGDPYFPTRDRCKRCLISSIEITALNPPDRVRARI